MKNISDQVLFTPGTSRDCLIEKAHLCVHDVSKFMLHTPQSVSHLFVAMCLESNRAQLTQQSLSS